MQHEIKAAIKSLPWYIAGVFLFAPLLLAPFTAGVSLLLYLIGPGALFTGSGTDFICGIIAIAGPGIAVWIFRQFIRLAVYKWKSSHIHQIHQCY